MDVHQHIHRQPSSWNSLWMILVGLPLLLSFSACLRTMHVVLKPGADGSGTLEYTLVLKEETVELFKQFSHEQLGDTATEGSDEERFRGVEGEMRRVADSSNGVLRVRSVDHIVDGSGDTIGATASYTYSDISKLNLSELFSSGSAMGNSHLDTSAALWTRFSFQKADPAVLTVFARSPEKVASLESMFTPEARTLAPDKKSKSTTSGSERTLNYVIAEQFDSLRVRMEIEPMSTILSTNATNVTKNRVTFADIDLRGLREYIKVRRTNPKAAARMESAIRSRIFVEKQDSVVIRLSR